MTPDFRALCAELLAAIEWNYGDPSIDRMALSRRARAALAEPEPATEESSAAQPADGNHIADARKMVLMPHPAEYARAVLARWGKS